MYDEILEQASKFDAKFKEYKAGSDLHDLIRKVAFDINAPHEDNHVRTPMTEELIAQLTGFGNDFIIDKMTVQYLHNKLFSGDLSSPGITGGYWRTHTAGFSTSTDKTADPIHIEYLMGHWLLQANKMTPTAMYKIFQCIHPFSDGNGRVGGILLAVKSYLDSDGKLMLAPCQ